MNDALVYITDLEETMGRTLADEEVAKAMTSLRYASNLVRAFAPWVDTLNPLPDAVVDVVTSLAERRFYASRSNVSQEMVGQVQRSYRASTSSFTPDELLLLRSALGTTANTSVSLAPPPVVL